jgi:hypothetical protein
VRAQELDRPGIAGQHGDQHAVADHDVDEAAEHALRAGPPAPLRLGRRNGRPQLPGQRLDHRGEQLLAGAEVVVHGRLRDPHLVGDHLQRRAGEAAPGEEADRCVDEAVPAVRRPDCCHRHAASLLNPGARSVAPGRAQALNPVAAQSLTGRSLRSQPHDRQAGSCTIVK